MFRFISSSSRLALTIAKVPRLVFNEIMGKISKVTPVLFMKLQKKNYQHFMVKNVPKI